MVITRAGESKWTGEKALLIGAAAVLSLPVVDLFSDAVVLGMMPVGPVAEAIEITRTEILAALPSFFSPIALPGAREGVIALAENIWDFLPFAALSISIAWTFLILTILKALPLANAPALPDVGKWEFTPWLIPAYGAIVAAGLILPESAVVDAFRNNLGLLCAACFWLQGFAVI